MSLPPLNTGKFRWDRLTYSSALGYALLAGGQSIGFVLGELRHQFRLSGVIAALHGSVFGLTALVAGLCGVRVVDRLGRCTSLVAAAMAISCGITMFCAGPAWPVTLVGAAIAGLCGALQAVVMRGLISDHRHSNFTLAHLRDRDVFVPWLHLLNAIFPEMATAVWAARCLSERSASSPEASPSRWDRWRWVCSPTRSACAELC